MERRAKVARKIEPTPRLNYRDVLIDQLLIVGYDLLVGTQLEMLEKPGVVGSYILKFCIIRSAAERSVDNPKGWTIITKEDIKAISGKIPASFKACNDAFNYLKESKIVNQRRNEGYMRTSIDYQHLTVLLGSVNQAVMKKAKEAEVATPIMGSPIYNIIYNNTIEFGYIYNKNSNSNNNKKDDKVNDRMSNSNPYFLLAKRLRRIVNRYTGKNIDRTTVKRWGGNFKAFVEKDGISRERIVTILEWYRGVVGDMYIPTALTGTSFRSRFLQLEAARKRDLVKLEKEVDPETIIQGYYKTEKEVEEMVEVYKTISVTIPGVKPVVLSENLCELAKFILTSRPKDFVDDRFELLTPNRLLFEYSKWLEEESWLKGDLNESHFKSSSRLFKKFIDEFSEGTARHQLKATRMSI